MRVTRVMRNTRVTKVTRVTRVTRVLRVTRVTRATRVTRVSRVSRLPFCIFCIEGNPERSHTFVVKSWGKNSGYTLPEKSQDPGILQNPVPQIPGLKNLDPVGA